MLDLFVIKASKANSDVHRTVNSFVWQLKDGTKRPIFHKCYEAQNVQHVMKILKKIGVELDINVSWYGIMYDNEHLTQGLTFSLPYHLKTDFDVLQVIRNDHGDMNQSPRFFRKHVVLPEESLMPSKVQILKYSLLVDGWIRPHVLR